RPCPLGKRCSIFITPRRISAPRWERPMVRAHPSIRHALPPYGRSCAIPRRESIQSWEHCVVCGRASRVVRPFIKRWPTFVSIATGCAIVRYGSSVCRLALAWWRLAGYNAPIQTADAYPIIGLTGLLNLVAVVDKLHLKAVEEK